MKFQIFNSETNQPIVLNDFDVLFCQFTGQEYDTERYGRWYHMLEPVLNTYGDIADNCKDSFLYKSLDIKDSRTLSLHQAAKVLIMWYGRTFLENDTFENMNYIKDVVNFFQHYNNKYILYFTY